MKLSPIAGVIAAFALASSAQAGTQFVVNGDFTQLSNGVGQLDTNTTASGWSGNGGYNFVFAQADHAVPGIYGGLTLWDANNGGSSSWNGLAAGPGNFAALDGAFMTQTLSQTITGLTPGASYDFSFSYAFGQQKGYDGDTVQNLTVSLGPVSGTSNDFNLSSHGFSGWQSAGGVIVATSSSEVLSFLAYGNKPVPPFALVSNVSLTAAVPEPATWTMMIAGIGGLGALARRRRAVSAVAAY